VKRASMTFEQRILRAAEPGELLCTATIRVACLAAAHFSPCPIPDHLLQRINLNSSLSHRQNEAN
jgi:acyl-CoA thioester hydrolase